MAESQHLKSQTESPSVVTRCGARVYARRTLWHDVCTIRLGAVSLDREINKDGRKQETLEDYEIPRNQNNSLPIGVKIPNIHHLVSDREYLAVCKYDGTMFRVKYVAGSLFEDMGQNNLDITLAVHEFNFWHIGLPLFEVGDWYEVKHRKANKQLLKVVDVDGLLIQFVDVDDEVWHYYRRDIEYAKSCDLKYILKNYFPYKVSNPQSTRTLLMVGNDNDYFIGEIDSCGDFVSRGSKENLITLPIFHDDIFYAQR